MTKATGKNNEIWNEEEFFNSENVLYKDDIQRFIEAQLPENTKKKPITN
jgi:hypothetical protein